jgi:Leucine-rich repeat (LRR) protein
MDDKGLTFYSWDNSDAEVYAKKHGYAFVVEYPAGDDEARLDEVHFPDETFRRYLSAYDRDGDGILSETEIGFIRSINVTNKKITSMRGIEYLTGVELLYCDGNGLTKLDVSKNAALKMLTCSFNKLTELDLSANGALVKLDCHNNSLTELDVSANKNLTHLNCSFNMLTKLDLSGNHRLMDVKCRNNKLENLDVSGVPELNTLVCNMNPFTRLDITNCRYLVEVVLNGKQSINGTTVIYESTEAHLLVEKKVKLITGVAPEPTPEPTPTPIPWPVPLREIPIDADHFPDEVFREYVAKECDPDGNGRLSGEEIAAVELIDVHWDRIKSLEGIQYFPALKALYCDSCYMKSLDVSKNVNLEILCCLNNYLSELNLSGCVRLKVLICSFNRLNNLDISACVELTEMDCSYSRVHGLDISHNTKLAKLICEGNSFSRLDIRKCPALIEVVKHGYRNETKEYVSYETNAGDALLRYGRGVELIK